MLLPDVPMSMLVSFSTMSSNSAWKMMELSGTVMPDLVSILVEVDPVQVELSSNDVFDGLLEFVDLGRVEEAVEVEVVGEGERNLDK